MIKNTKTGMPVGKRELYEGRKVFARIPVAIDDTEWEVVHTLNGDIRLESTSGSHYVWYIWYNRAKGWSSDNTDIKEFYFLNTDPMSVFSLDDNYVKYERVPHLQPTSDRKITAPKYKIGDVIVWKREGETTYRQMLISRAWTEGNEWKYADNSSSCIEDDVIEYDKEEEAQDEKEPCLHIRKEVKMTYGKYNPTEYQWTCKDCGEHNVEEM